MPLKPTTLLPGVLPVLPAPLEPLRELAYNFAWSFLPKAQRAFAELDAELWASTGNNPVQLLCTVSDDRLARAATDAAYVSLVNSALNDLRELLSRPGWFAKHASGLPTNESSFLAAYFCAEFGLHESFQIYSGGLGLLAGDHLKAAAELRLPLIGVGLLYRNGYFHQALDSSGTQQEQYPPLDAPRQPVQRVIDVATGRPLTIGVQLPAREVRVAVWRADVGSVRLYLLDTNIAENADEDREITANLYLGDQNRRIQQELVLGIGGVRTLEAIGERPTVFHMNEGHAAFLAVERIRLMRQRTGLTFDQAREAAAVAHVFTTHTPVPAGIDHFSVGLVQHYFGGYHEQLGLDMEGFMALGRENVSDKAEAFSMAILAIRCSRWCNGVSKLHGVVSRRMWNRIWPETPEDDVPIGHVTNGIHPATWLSPVMGELFDKHLPASWRSSPDDPTSWSSVDKISDAELWNARTRCRAEFVKYLKARAAQGKTGGIAVNFDPNLLTIGFARRFAGYKRGTLLLHDIDRLKKLLSGSAPGAGVQLVLSGKSHPGDGWGKDLIRQVVEFARSPAAMGRVVFLEDYDIGVARQMVQGCDVWLNTPIRGLEASGTSGMKAALNGVLHASILDGWWDEGFAPEVGFKIPDTGIYPNDAPNPEREAAEARALYELIERQIVPEFTTRPGGVPTTWTARMRACIRALAPFFSTQRMVAEYATKYYFPAHTAAARLAGPDLTDAREVSDHIDRYRKHWAGVRVKSVECAPAQGGSGGLAVAASVKLGMLRPDEVLVQWYFGPLGKGDDSRRVVTGRAGTLTAKAPLPGGDGTYHYVGLVDQAKDPAQGQGLEVRVLPGDPRLVTPFIPGLIHRSAAVVAEPDPGAHL